MGKYFDLNQDQATLTEKIIFDIIIVMLLAVCVFCLFNIGIKLTTSGAECIQDPLGYYGNLGEDKCVSCLSGTYYFKNKSEPIAELIESDDLDYNGIGLRP